MMRLYSSTNDSMFMGSKSASMHFIDITKLRILTIRLMRARTQANFCEKHVGLVGFWIERVVVVDDGWVIF